MIYQYRCRDCGSVRESLSRTDTRPCHCGGLSSRDYRATRFNTATAAFETHFNTSVGKVITSQYAYREELKRASERSTLETGIEHNYVPVESDPKSNGVTSESLHESAAECRKQGVPELPIPKGM
jgi:hypothetical protein